MIQSRLSPLSHPLALPLVLLALATSSSAQFDAGNGHSFDLNATMGELGACSTAVPGHLYGELGLDAVLLFEVTPMIFKAPEVYRARTDIPMVANDVAVYPRFLGGNGPDWVFAVGSDGLQCWVWDGASFQNIAPVDQSGSQWLGAPVVGTADVDGDADMDLFGVNAARNRVLLSRFVAQVWNNYTMTPVLPEAILAVEPIEWDGVPHQELAVRTANFLFIVDYSATVIDMQPLVQSGTLMRVVDIPGAVNQAVCVFSNGPAGPHQWLDVLAYDCPHQTLDLGSTGPVGIQFGDFDLDQRSDFVLSHTSGANLQLWRAEMVGNKLNFSQSFMEPNIPVPQWGSIQFNEATPAVADFDGDSDPDVLFAPVGTDRIDLNSNDTFDESTLMCTVKDGSMTLEEGGGRFDIKLNVPQVVSTESSGSGWSHVKVTVWRQPRFDYLLLPVPFIATTYYPIVSDEVDVPIQTPYQQWFEDIYHIEARLVERSGNVNLAQGPGYTAMVGLAEPINALWAIEGLPSGGSFHGVTFQVPPEFEYPFNGGTSTFIRGQETLGGGGRRSSTSTPFDGVPPPVGDATPEGLPNPLFMGHEVRYDHDEAAGTWGGGSGCLPDLPKTPVNFPPLG